VRTIRLIWIEQSHALASATGEADDSVIRRGIIEPAAAGNFPGPAGSYRLLVEEFWSTIEPHDPAPTFLHESYEGLLEKWVNSLPDAADEVTIVARVRDAVMQLVEMRLAADPEAISASPTVTTTEPTPRGMVVVGRSVVFRPARSRRRSAQDPADGLRPGRPGV
jgi:hypothetical protein